MVFMKKKINKVYLLHYCYEYENGEDDVELLGVFSSEKVIQDLLCGFKEVSELRSVLSYLTIDEYTIGEREWLEGFGFSD